MALTIMLEGNFDYERLYELLRDKKLFENVSSLEPQRFSFHLKDVEDVFYQVYPTGRVRVDTDDYSDPRDLIKIIHEAAWLASGCNPRFKVVRCLPMPTTYERMGSHLIRAQLGVENPHGVNEALELARQDVYRMVRVFEAVRDFQREA